MNNYFRRYFLNFLKSILWTLPFLSFLFGYLVMNFFLPVTSIKTPLIVGKSVVEALEVLSSVNLTMKIIDKNQDVALKEPVVIQQYPKAGVDIKSNKIINVIISEPKKPLLMPDFINNNQLDFINKLDNYKKVIIPVISPNIVTSGTIIAQFPEKNMPIESSFFIYMSVSEDLFIMPSMIGVSVFEIELFLNKNNIPYRLYEGKRKSHATFLETSKIIEQQPSTGFVFSLKNPPLVHLTVE